MREAETALLDRRYKDGIFQPLEAVPLMKGRE
jgi:predicted DNA-binding antitoxin AbrB/MazE fold protein